MKSQLSLGLKIRYGVADLGFALVYSAVQFFILFYYTDIALINPAIAGSALLAGKLTWDAINDPVFGYLSDRTKSRFGRRRVYMLFGVIPLALTAWLLFSLPVGLDGAAAFFAVLATFLLYDTFYTMTNVPYGAMTAELTYDYNERASLTAIRMIFSLVGYILGAGITTLLAQMIQDLAGVTAQTAWSLLGLFFGVVILITVLITAITVKEPGGVIAQPSKMPPLKAVLTTLKIRPFVILLVAFFISSFSFTLLTSLFPYFVIYQLGMKDSVPTVLLTMLVSVMLFLIPIKRISDKINKGPAYAWGLLVASAAILAGFLLPQGPTPLIYVIAVVAGIGFSGQWVFPWSMVPDVIEYDQLVTGERREGIYFGIWNFLQKLTGAFGIAMAGWSLSWFGYVPNVEQSSTALLGIRLFFSVIPAIVILVSLPLLFRFPITRESHAHILEQLKLKQPPQNDG